MNRHIMHMWVMFQRWAVLKLPINLFSLACPMCSYHKHRVWLISDKECIKLSAIITIKIIIIVFYYIIDQITAIYINIIHLHVTLEWISLPGHMQLGNVFPKSNNYFIFFSSVFHRFTLCSQLKLFKNFECFSDILPHIIVKTIEYFTWYPMYWQPYLFGCR